jgi:hypothetical protein
MTREELLRRIGNSGDPLKALARAQARERRADRQAAKQLGVSAQRARNLRLGEAITAAFHRMSQKVRGK